MPETIIVQLNSAPENLYYFLRLNEAQKIVAPAARLSLGDISKQSQQQTLIALLPPEEVVLLTVKLPLLKKNQLLQAIPFAIQEELSEKIEDYRFTVLDEQEPSGEVHVAVIEKNRIQHWYQLLSEHQLEVHALIPTLLCVPVQTQRVNIMTHGTTCLVRSGQYSGFVTYADNLTALLEIHLAEIEKPEKILLRQYGTVTHDEAAYQHFIPPIETQLLPESDYFTALAVNALNNLCYNVLWGKLQARSKTQKVRVYWQLTLAFAIAILVIAVLNKIVQYSLYSSQNVALTKQIAALYTENFPGSTSMVAPKLRLENKLKNLNAIASGNPYLNLLGTAGQVLKDSTLLKINSLQFGNKTLALDVNSQNFSDLNVVTKQLEAKGLTVTQSNAHVQGSAVSTTLLIKDTR